MKKKNIMKILLLSALLLGLYSCHEAQDNIAEEKKFGIIKIGNLNMKDNINTSLSRSDNNGSVAAETIEWLKKALTNGIKISYSNIFTQDRITGNEQFCTLKYDGNKYSLTNNTDNMPAEWLGNGKHLFSGRYIPDGLKLTGTIQSNQNDTTNYNMLWQYTSVKPESFINATVDRISIPFQHRLARIIAQIIIAPDVKQDYMLPTSPTAIIKGYDKTKNGGGKDCSLRFCNVQVLTIVNESEQLIWSTKGAQNKVIPHFIGERDSVIYKKDSLDADKYYENVPTFDLIVRPTYPTTSVMVDEKPDVTNEDNNQVLFSLTLDNGMIYERTIVFDLNPNEQTTLTLFITRDGIEYNDSGVTDWTSDNFKQDDYYGIDNLLGHELSLAGSCWQRAYQIDSGNYDVTDGSNPKDTQYLTAEKFIEYLKEAKEGDNHHGDYFILTGDLTLPADWVPFNFTGHLDGRNHNITLSGSANALFLGLNGSYDAATGTANVHGDNSPMKGYRAEIMNLTITNNGASLVNGECSGNIRNCQITNPGATGKFYDTINSSYGQINDCSVINK